MALPVGSTRTVVYPPLNCVPAALSMRVIVVFSLEFSEPFGLATTLMNCTNRLGTAGPGCQIPWPGVLKVGVELGITSNAFVSTTVPSDVNVASPGTGMLGMGGVVGTMVNCQDPTREGVAAPAIAG